MSTARTTPAARAHSRAVEAVREVVRINSGVSLHRTPAVRLAARDRVRRHTDSCDEALAAVRGARLRAVECSVGGGE